MLNTNSYRWNEEPRDGVRVVFKYSSIENFLYKWASHSGIPSNNFILVLFSFFN